MPRGALSPAAAPEKDMPSPASPLSPDAQQAAALIPPDDIEARSFAIIDGEIPEPRPFTGYAWEVARRLVHTSGDISLPGDLYLPDESVCGGVQALRYRAAIPAWPVPAFPPGGLPP